MLNHRTSIFWITVCVYAAIKITLFLNYPLFYQPIADAQEYLTYAKLPLFSKAFYLHRPFFYPLFIKIFNSQQIFILSTQCLFSIFAWVYFGNIFYRQWLNTKSKLALFCLYFGLLLSLNLGISQWDNMVLTESLTTSGLVLWLSLLYEFFSEQRTFKHFKKILFILVSFVLFHIRDANSVFLIMMTPIFFYGLARDTSRNTKLFCIFVILFNMINFGFSAWTANQGNRWWFSMGNVLTERLAPQFPDAIQYFSEHHMPAPEKNFILQNKNTLNGHAVFNLDPKSATWSKTNLKPLYFQYLLTHPPLLFSPLFFDEFLFSHSLDPQSLYAYWYGKPHVAPIDNIFRILNNSLFATSHFIITVIFLMILRLWINIKMIKNIGNLMLCSYLFLTIFPMGLFIWHADAIEIKRHFLIVYEVIWILFMLTLCEISKNRSPSPY